MAIALFYAVGTGWADSWRPALFGALIESGSRTSCSSAMRSAAALMLAAAVRRSGSASRRSAAARAARTAALAVGRDDALDPRRRSCDKAP
jgi:hypothetical protein